jgi:oligopeptide transport system permease protein
VHTAAPAATAEAVAAPARRGVNRTWRQLRRSPGTWIGGFLVAFYLFIALVPAPVAGLFGHGDPHNCSLANSKAGPSLATGHPFGFDVQGCDLYANVIYGARDSVSIGLMVTVLTTLIAITLGVLAGYFGSWVDILMSRLSEIVFALPVILGAVVILDAFKVNSAWALSLVLTIFAWPTAMRVVRASTVSVRNRNFLAAARALGLSTPRILRTHVLPNTIGPAVVLATLQIGGVITAEATLTYLGVGLQPPAISWGLQLSVAQDYFQQAANLLIFPAAALVLAVAGFVTLGETLRRVFSGDRDAI